MARLGRRLGLRAASGSKHRPSAKERRAAFLDEARTFTPYVSAQRGDEVFLVPTRDDRIGARLFVKRRSKDMTVLATALGHLDRLGHARPADPVFVDVGANLGTATVTALCHHGFATAVSLEPSPGNFTALRLGLVANDLDGRVTAMQVAIKHGWPETENALIELVTPHYTDVVDLRHRNELEPIADFRALVDRLKQSTDALLVRR